MDCDLLIIGGGVNGAGIARDAAGRGYKTILVEADDLASGTSSGSTKLIHGGLRYLEFYEFSLVRKALKEREALLNLAPHIIWPMRFILPHDRHLRPAWMIRLGLFLYDYLGGRKRLPASRGVKLSQHPLGALLNDVYKRGFEYSDCWVEDARLVVLNAMDARDKGATILTRTRFREAIPTPGGWGAALEDRRSGAQIQVQAKLVVNAAGPWAGRLLSKLGDGDKPDPLRLVKGSHIIAPKLHDRPEAFILQNPDGRIVFIIPYERDYSLIGTTEEDFEGDPRDAKISAAERGYLLDSVNRYLKKPVTAGDIVWDYAAVRPLYDSHEKNASAVTRDFILDMAEPGGAPLLSVYGGKITTYRVLAEKALKLIAEKIDEKGKPWTARAPLPGGDIENADFDKFLAVKRLEYPWLPEGLGYRLCRDYGTRIDAIIGNARALDGLGENIAGDLYAAEVDYLTREEFAMTAADILWRRSKLGLHLGKKAEAALSRYLESRV